MGCKQVHVASVDGGKQTNTKCGSYGDRLVLRPQRPNCCQPRNGTSRGIHHFFTSNVTRNTFIERACEQHGEYHVFQVRFVVDGEEPPRLVSGSFMG